MRQASRRSWRIGQTEPVQVVFMAYRNTLQADALKLVAQKLQPSRSWSLRRGLLQRPWLWNLVAGRLDWPPPNPML